MLTALLNLPQCSLDRICSFLDKTTLCQLREVCKETKEQVELFMLRTQETVVNDFGVYTDMNDNKTTLSFSSSNQRDFIIWKCCFQTLLNRIDMGQSLLTIDDESLEISMTLEQLETLLEQMKPRIQKSKFLQIFIHNESEMMRMFTSFLNKKYVRSVQTSLPKMCEVTCQKAFVEFIEQVTPDSVQCNLSSTKGATDMVLRLADLVKSLTICVDACELSLVREILSRKCERLSLPHTVLLSVIDLEKLIQMLSHIGKKCEFSCWTSAPPMARQIGVYKVQVTEIGGENYFEITHLK